MCVGSDVFMPMTVKSTAARMWCCLVWYKFNSNSEGCTASIFNVREMLRAWLIFDGGIVFIQDILLDYMLPHPRRKCCSVYDGCSKICFQIRMSWARIHYCLESLFGRQIFPKAYTLVSSLSNVCTRSISDFSFC